MSGARQRLQKRILVVAESSLARSIVNLIKSIQPEHFEIVVLAREDYDSLADVLVGSSARRVSDEVSIFQLREYDFVIFQDVFPSADRLVGAGYVWPALDYYELGNFETKKLCLVTDPISVWLDCSGDRVADREEAFARLAATVDEKNGFSFLDLVHGDGADSASELLESFLGGGLLAPPAAVDGAGDQETLVRISSSVTDPASAAVRRSILRRSRVLVVDDDWDSFQLVYQGFAGRPPAHPTGASGVRSLHLGVLCDSDGEREPERVDGFHELERRCHQEAQSAIVTQRSPLPCILVTDILFKGHRESGMELIEGLRNERSFGDRLGLVAFSGFSTHFVVNSAYQLGADYVVSKGQQSGGSLSHGGIARSGMDRLMLTVAWLLFLRTRLHDLRNIVTPGGRREAEEVARELALAERAIPLHAVPQHVRREWLATLDLLRRYLLYGSESDAFKESWERVSQSSAAGARQ